MDLRRSTTVVALSLVGVVLTAAGLLSFGWLAGAVALTLVVLVAAAGFWLERGSSLDSVLRFSPTRVTELDPIRCGVDKTAPRLLEKSNNQDGKNLLSFVSRIEGRTLGRELGDAIANERSVVVALIGNSKTGKTRCVFEVIRNRLPGALVFAPRGGPETVRQVVTHRRFRSPKQWSVLWLDDLEDFIDPKGGRGVDDAFLDEVLGLPRVVVAITAAAQQGIEHLADVPRLGRLTPHHGHDGQLIAAVLGRALADAIGDEGIGAACVSGPQLLDIHQTGCHPAFENGATVVEGSIIVECLIAAAQLRFGSLTREQLLSAYRQSGTSHASREGFDRGLQWATRPLYAEVALVLGDDDGFRVYSYVAENAPPIGEYRKRAEPTIVATVGLDDLLAMAAAADEVPDRARALRLYELSLTRIDDKALWASVMASVGRLQLELGRLGDALASCERALAEFGQLDGEEQNTARTLGNLGTVQRRLGRLDEARAAFTRALAMFEQMEGEEQHVAHTLSILGEMQREAGQFEDALGHFERALAIKQRVYGKSHPEVANTLDDLGLVHGDLGQFEQALGDFKLALAIKEQAYGKDHPSVARTLDHLGILQSNLGRFEEAFASQSRALAIFEQAYGEEHLDVAIALTNLGTVQRELGRLDAALASHRRALLIKERLCGEGHYEVAITLANLGVAQRALGQVGDALASNRRALAIFELTYGAEHPNVAIMLTNIGTMQHDLRQLTDSLTSHERALAILERTHSGGPECAHAMANIGVVQRDLGRLSEAEANFRTALVILNDQLPADHPRTRWVLTLLGQLVARRGEVPLNIDDPGRESRT
jgi:tetratricopeptide (TPR) repeat protein